VTDREQLIRRAVEAVNRQDWDTLQGLNHPESTMSQPIPDVGQMSYPSVTGTFRTSAEVAEGARGVTEALNGLEIELRQTEELGDDGLLCEYLLHIGPDRSAQLVWMVHRFRDGLIASSTAFSTKDAAREAIARGA
jgi:hypothetical protein